MAFNKSQFNLCTFNIDQNKDIKLHSVYFTETVNVSVGTASQITVYATANERVISDSDGERAYRIGGQMSETVTGTSEGMVSVVIAPVFLEEVTDDCYISADISPELVPVAEVVETDSNIFADITIVSAYTNETISNTNIISANVRISAELDELVSANADSEAYDIRVCYIGTSANPFILRPGQRLIIDANNYNVHIDGVNAIWYQAGDWIDELTRETTMIEITAAANAGLITASILYTERYL